MTPDQQEVGELIRSGKYFDEARAWYKTLYIGPISERAFFLMIAALAVVISFFAVVALMEFLPLKDKPGVIIANKRMDDTVPIPIRIRAGREPIDPAVEQFFVRMYVDYRESYSAPEYSKNAMFILAHSDAPTAANYRATYDARNPRSPAAILGERGQRIVTVKSITLNTSRNPRVATIKFSTELSGINSQTKTQWTATLGYYYSPMKVTDGKDAAGDPTVNVEDPQFQVVNYAVSQTP